MTSRLFVGGVVLGLSTVVSQAAIIDDFSVTTASWPVSIAPGFLSAVVSESTPTVLFGNRTTGLTTLLPAPNNSIMQPLMAIYTPPGGTHNVLEVATPVNYPAIVSLSYNDSANPFTPLDLSANVGVTLTIDSYDFPDSQPMFARIVARDEAFGVFEFGTYLPFAATSGSLYIPFSSFPSYNPSTTFQFGVQLMPAPGGDFRLSRIETVVPEPSSLALFAPVSLLVTRRRR